MARFLKLFVALGLLFPLSGCCLFHGCGGGCGGGGYPTYYGGGAPAYGAPSGGCPSGGCGTGGAPYYPSSFGAAAPGGNFGAALPAGGAPIAMAPLQTFPTY